MALIKCPECNTEISDKAPQCMKCGVPIAKQNITATLEIDKVGGWAIPLPMKVNIFLGVGSQPIASCKTGESVTITCLQPMDIIVEFDKKNRVAVSVEPSGVYKVGLDVGFLNVKGYAERIL